MTAANSDSPLLSLYPELVGQDQLQLDVATSWLPTLEILMHGQFSYDDDSGRICFLMTGIYASAATLELVPNGGIAAPEVHKFKILDQSTQT